MDDGWAAAEAARLVAAAREDAVAQVRAVLRERYAAQLLEAAEALTAPRPPREGDGLWLYGVQPAHAAAAPQVPGVDDGEVELVVEGDLAALVTSVPLTRFGEAALSQQLEDLTRLEQLARAHARVLEAALDAGTLVPSRICTIYAGEQSLRSMLAERHDELRQALARVDGAAEWGVKVVMAREQRDGAVAATSGLDYIERKRAARERAEQTRESADAAAAAIHARLAEHAAGAELGRPHDRQLSKHDGEMVLNGSYLVARERESGFRALLDELAARYEPDGMTFELTGPWPPYHFAGS